MPELAGIELQVDPGLSVPAGSAVDDWIAAGFSELGRDGSASVGIRLVDRDQSELLNRSYRGRPGPTNVLSFPAPAVPGLPAEEPAYLGDLAICTPLVEEQARQQGKTVQAHFAHMVVHGLLHLTGYDHQTEAQARDMEALEIRILKRLGFPDPYAMEHSIQQ